MKIREPLLAQEVEVDSIEYDQGAWCERTQRIDVLDRNIVARQHDDIEFPATRPEKLRDRPHVGRKLYLDTELLQRGHIRLTVFEIVRDKRDLAVEIDEDREYLLHAHRPGILIRRQHAGVDDENVLPRTTVALQLGCHAVGTVACQLAFPLAGEDRLIGNLMALYPCTRVGTRRHALEVHDLRERLVVDLASGSTHGESKVGVFVVCRCIAGVEAAEPIEQRARYRETRVEQ